MEGKHKQENKDHSSPRIQEMEGEDRSRTWVRLNIHATVRPNETQRRSRNIVMMGAACNGCGCPSRWLV